MLSACEINHEDKLAAAIVLTYLVNAWETARTSNKAAVAHKATASISNSSTPAPVPNTYMQMQEPFRVQRGQKSDAELPGVIDLFAPWPQEATRYTGAPWRVSWTIPAVSTSRFEGCDICRSASHDSLNPKVWSCCNPRSGPKPLRSAGHLWGLPWLDGPRNLKLKDANRLRKAT